MKLRGAILGLMLAVVAQVAGASIARAAAASLTLDPSHGPAGTTFTGTYVYTPDPGTACPTTDSTGMATTVSFRWDGQDITPQPPPTLNSNCQARATGLQMPPDARSRSSGSHQVCASDSASKTQGCATFTVDPTPTPTPSPTPTASATPSPTAPTTTTPTPSQSHTAAPSGSPTGTSAESPGPTPTPPASSSPMTSAEAATPAPNAPTACGAPGRDPTPAELSHFLPQGGTVDQVDVAILGSPEYYDLNGGTDTTFVRALYRDLLTRQPDPAGVAAASTVLGGPWQQDQGAHARAQLAGAILGSSEYRSLAVHRLDLMLIGRPPTAAEVQAATTTTTASAERRGLEVDQDLVAGIVSSPEFLALAGGTDSGFAALLYHDLLGRSPTDAEVQSLAGYKDLDAATRQRTVVGIVNSPEYRTAAINQTFHALLRGGCFGAGQPHPQCHVATRQPTQAELAAALSQGQTDEQVRAAIMGSQEYLASAGGTDEGFARALYRDLLGRQPTPADLSSTRANLGAGGGKRDQVVAAILGSPEYRTIQVHDADSQFLGRSPSAAESTQGVATLAGGATTEELIAGILGSPEYFADAGASNEGFARALYRDVLERVSDAAPAAPVAQLDAGSTPTQVAGTILGSDEYRTKAVMLDDYLLLSPKPGTAGAACGTAPSRGLGFLDTVGKLPGGWIGPGILLLAFLLAGALAIRRVKVRFYWDRLGNRPGGAAAVAAASAAAVTGAAGGGAAAAASIRKGSVRGSVRIVDDMTGAPIDGVTVRFVPVAGGEVLTGTTDAAGRMQVMFNPKEYKTTQWEPHKAPGLDAPSQDVVVPPAAAAGDLTTNRLNVFLPDGTPIRARMTITWHPPEAQ